MTKEMEIYEKLNCLMKYEKLDQLYYVYSESRKTFYK